MDDSANVVQQVLSAAAEENGEFELPLKEERIKSMRAALVERRHLVDEAALSCLFAYMNKASQDQLDGMVSIFQTMLQQWAAIELLEAKPSNAVLLKMLDGGAEEWDAILSSGVTKQEDKDDLLTAVQQCVEKVRPCTANKPSIVKRHKSGRTARQTKSFCMHACCATRLCCRRRPAPTVSACRQNFCVK